MRIELGEVNWLAVGVAGLAVWVVGAVWYAALFGKVWQRLHGHSDEKLKEMQAARPPAVFLGGMLVAYLVLAAVGVLVAGLGIGTAVGGATLGVVLWVGPCAAIGFTGWLASDRRVGTFGLDAAFQFVALVMMGAILGAWR